MRKLLFSLFALLLATSAFAQTAESHFEFDSSTGTITKYTYNRYDERNVVIPSQIGGVDVKIIGEYAFEDSYAIRTVTIPNTVETIQDYAFYFCMELTTINIGSSVSYIGQFEECENLSTINVDPANPYFSCVDNVLFNAAKTTLIKYMASATSYSIPGTVETIGNRAFYGKGITSIVIPNSVKVIEDYAFSRCSELSSINLPETLTSIGGFAFMDSGITAAVIPNSVTTLGESVFCACPNLKTITLGKNVDTFDVWDCESLEEIKVDSENTHFVSLDGVLYTKDMTEIIKYPAAKSGTIYEIPNTVTSLGWNSGGAFTECKYLTHIVIPNTITQLGYANEWVSVNIFNETPTTITCYSSVAPELCRNAFYNNNNRTVYTPKNSTGYTDGLWPTIFTSVQQIPEFDYTLEDDMALFCPAKCAVEIPAGVEVYTLGNMTAAGDKVYAKLVERSENGSFVIAHDAGILLKFADESTERAIKRVDGTAGKTMKLVYTADASADLSGNVLTGAKNDVTADEDGGYYAFKMDGENPVLAPVAVGEKIPAGQAYLKTATAGTAPIKIDFGTPAGIETISVEAESDVARYYDLRGIEVNSDALTPGLYIRRCGTKTDKVVIR